MFGYMELMKVYVEEGEKCQKLAVGIFKWRMKMHTLVDQICDDWKMDEDRMMWRLHNKVTKSKEL